MLANNIGAVEYDFPSFLAEAWPILEPANPLVPSWHLDLICEHLSEVTDGKTRKLLINIPPRSGKSSIVTILWPAWSWTKKPWMRFIFCSYAASLSVKHSIDRRRIMESDWYRSKWGNRVQFTTDQNQKQEYENTNRGVMVATSVGGTLTGKGGDVIVEDDMLNPQEAESAAARYHMVSMHKNVLSSRLDNPKTGARVVVEHRTHHLDLSNHILTNEKGWTHLSLPLVADAKKTITFPVSGRVVEREFGDLLIPERIGQKEIEDLKSAMGTRTFVAQCQQNPTAEEGNILKRNWWKFWTSKPEGADITIQSWDMTFKKTENGSFVVGQVWKKRGPNLYLMEQFRDRVDFAGTIPAVLAMTGKWIESTAKLIEDAANGPAIISQLSSRIDGIVPIKPSGTKIARAQAVAPLVEAGNVFLPNPQENPWVYDFIEECAAFKGATGETNDQVDAMSQAITWLHELGNQAPVDIEGDFNLLDEQDIQIAGGFR
jgi:predicted phage terminase large subunit-like protein